MANPLRILVVEDEKIWIEVINDWLGQAGYEVDVVSEGAKAIARITQDPPDCLILDFVLPDMDGIEVAKTLRSTPSLNTLPIIMLTAHRKEKVRGLESGADYYVIKSHDPEELLTTLKALFRRKDLDAGILHREDLTLNPKDKTVYQNNKLLVTLSPKRFDLLYLLISKSPKPLSKEELFEFLDVKYSEISNALNLMLNRLRDDVGKDIANRIKSVKGFGYLYLDPSEREKQD